MWKCPNCETLNNEDCCAICGTKRPAQTYQQQSQQNVQTVSSDKRENKSVNSMLVVIIVLFTVVIVALAGIIIALSLQDKDDASENSSIPTIEATQPSMTQTPEATVQPTDEPTVTVQPNGVADETEIFRIRDIYNYTQDVLPDCEVMSDGYYGIKYYYYDSYEKPIRVDVPIDSEFGYGRNYYFDDGKLCFALVFKDKQIQHRFYFKDGTLIRWKDYKGEIFDNTHDNREYRDWSVKIQEDASIFES